MVLKQKLTPEAFLSAPRYGDAVPSPSGDLAVVKVSTHTFGESSTKKEVIIMELDTGNTWRISEDDKVTDVKWLPVVDSDDDQLIWLRKGEKGRTEVTVVKPVDKEGKTESYIAAEIDAPVEAMKLKEMKDGSVAFAVVGRVGEDGKPHNEETVEKPASSARIYDTARPREWDTYIHTQKYTIWYSKLIQKNGKWELAGALQNALEGTKLESPADIYEPNDAEDAYDIGAHGIAFTSREPDIKDPVHMDCADVYFAPIEAEDFTKPVASPATRVSLQSSDTYPGVCSNVRFSPDGAMLAFLVSPLKCPAVNRLHTGHVTAGAVFDVLKHIVGEEWALVPSAFEYAPSGQSLYVQAGNCGRTSLYELGLRHKAKPKCLTSRGSVSAQYPVRNKEGKFTSLLVSGSSLVESSFTCLIELEQSEDYEPRMVSTASRDGSKYGLSYAKQISEIYYEGAGDYAVQAWVIKPSDFDESKKYPLALMIHGGPASAFQDEWHKRWNGAVWAEQGYIVVQPNFSGSTTFGIEHAKRIYGSWGGYPYEDLVKCMDHLKNVPYIDIDNAVAAGGSYGGYMVNWIMGQPLAQRFKAIICHDPVYSTLTMDMTSDETVGLADFKGPAYPWSNHAELDKWNPARADLLANWKHAPPTLVIHSDNDFRCPITEGLATFKTLRHQGVRARFLNFPDENHFVQKPENALVWHREVFAWMREFTAR